MYNKDGHFKQNYPFWKKCKREKEVTDSMSLNTNLEGEDFLLVDWKEFGRSKESKTTSIEEEKQLEV